MIMRTDEMATDMGCILEGEEAVSCGLIDRVGSVKEAFAWLKGRA